MAESITIDWRSSGTPGYLDCARKAFASAHRTKLMELGYDLAEGVQSVGAAMGQSIHTLAAHMLRTKRDSGDIFRGDIDEALAKTWEKFDTETSNGVLWDKTTPHEQTARERIHALARAMVPTAQLIEPMRVEEKYEHLVSPLGEEAAVKINLAGTIDALDIHDTLYDHKTGSKPPRAHAQMGCYLILLKLHDEPARRATLNYIPRLGITKLDDIIAQTLVLDPQECIDAAWSALREIQRHYEAWLESLALVEEGKLAQPDLWAIPANSMTQNCTVKYCIAYGTGFCKIGAAGKGEQ